jgi:very-short-patch-repair endonuclease
VTPAILKAVTGLPWVAEHRFALEHIGAGPAIRNRLKAANLQDWRFDFACHSVRLAVEIEGGAWTGGRHTRGKGFNDDLRKYGAAMRLGWTVYRCSHAMVASGEAYDTITAVCRNLEQRHAPAPSTA